MIDFKQIKRLLKQDNTNLLEVKVALLGDTATQFLATAIKGVGIERGYNINLFEAEYNQVERQVLDPTSDLHAFGAKYTVVFQSTHKLLETYSLGNLTDEGVKGLMDERLNFIRTLCETAEGKIIYFNYPEIDDTVFGQFANRTELSFTWQIRQLNCKLMRLTQEYPNLFICDIAALQNQFGREWMFDSSVYVSTEMVLSLDALPYVGSRVMDIICACKGQFKKCLILDLDNTLWGGVVGDDGLEGIQLGHGLGIGKAFTEFQMWVKKLRQRGIIVCVASKNDEDKAKEPFLKHPDMILKLDDIAVFQANWETKVDNIRTIQSILNIAFDSMVFLDDNPFERNIVREHIPGITVPELPEDPAEYLEYLYSLNLFETANYSSADKDRTKQYQVEAKRVSLKKTFDSEADFLKSLGMLHGGRHQGFRRRRQSGRPELHAQRQVRRQRPHRRRHHEALGQRKSLRGHVVHELQGAETRHGELHAQHDGGGGPQTRLQEDCRPVPAHAEEPDGEGTLRPIGIHLDGRAGRRLQEIRA